MADLIESNLLYRFRPVENLLGEYQQLERQSIFFAPPEILNDPAEGFRVIYFKGDAVLWDNLFKHYLACLVNSTYDYLLFDERESIEDLNHSFSPEDMIPEGMKKHWEELKACFLGNEGIKSLIKNIVEVTAGLSQVETSYFLSLIHPFALNCVYEIFSKMGVFPAGFSPYNDFELSKVLKPEYFDSLKTLEMETREKVLEFMLFQYQLQALQVPMVLEYSKDYQEPNKRFLITYFPTAYVKNLESLMYPNWFTACFMTRATNSAVWGNYGQNHSGVCMIFNADLCEDGKHSLKLDNAVIGYGDKGKILSKSSFEFHEIRYTHLQEPLNFFASIGQLPIPQVYKQWTLNDCGERSAYDLSFNDEWREQYWKRFYLAITQKSKEWQYENEHRLIINNMGGGYSQGGTALNYDFKSLKGIIFGINTKYEDKMKIIRIIESKVRSNNHYDFKFYQAYYCRHSGEIKHAELNRLRFAKSESEN